MKANAPVRQYAIVRLQDLNEDIEDCSTKKEVELLASRRLEVKLLLKFLDEMPD